MSQNYDYNFTFAGQADDIVVTTADAISAVVEGQAAGGWQGASGYAVTGIHGEFDGEAITGLVGSPGTYNVNFVTQIAEDNTIYRTGAVDPFNNPTFDGLGSEGIAFETADGKIWNLYYYGNLPGAGGNVFGLAEWDGSQVNSFLTDDSPGFVFNEFTPPCYREGTRLATERGEVAVEDLKVGDLAVAASGARRPVKWIGRREVDCGAQRDPHEAWPIRIAADAFDAGVPRRDLWVSPGHNICFAGALMPASVLVNGVSVIQEPAPRVTYFHVELDAHDILLADGLPAESYLDQGNRAAFENGTDFVEAHPEVKSKHWSETCLPLVQKGPEVVAAKRQLIERLAEKGCRMTTDSDLHMLADRVRIEPMRLRADVYGFSIPEHCREIWLVSRRFVPAEVQAESDDRRSLGLRVGALSLDGDAVDLADAALFGQGWWDFERSSTRVWRWTCGVARLPANTRIALVDIIGHGFYREEQQKPRLTVVG